MDLKGKLDSSLDSIIFLQDEKQRIGKNCSKNKRNLAPNKQDVTKTDKKSQRTNRNCSKHISHEIHVEKRDFKCVINLNTTICKHKSRYRKCERHHSSKYTHEERTHKSKRSVPRHGVRDKHSMVPKCLRPNCANSTLNKRRRYQEACQRRNVTRPKVNYGIGKNEFEYEEIKRSIHDKYNRSSFIDHKKKSRILVTPIPSSHLKVTDNDMTYEDISSTSIDTYLEEPKLSEQHRKHNNHKNAGHQESKLDTLIKRTKERERQLVEQFRFRSFYQPLRTSTPVDTMHEEISSGDLPMSCSDMDISFNSQSTLVLESRNLPYSPSCPIEELYLNGDTEITDYMVCRGYSSSSPPRPQDYKLKSSENNDFKSISIKSEPAMDIEAYSPTHYTDMFLSKCDLPKACIKLETKSVVTPTISPIYNEVDGLKTSLQICKIESIKSETD